MSRILDDKQSANLMTQGLINGLYSPNFLPEEINVSEYLVDPEQQKKEAVASLEEKLVFKPKEDQHPLTEEEAKEVDLLIERTQKRITATKTRIANMRKAIDEAATSIKGEKGNELSFNVNIKKKYRVKKAIRKVFGVTTNTITYSMYKEALEMKRQIEARQVDDYVNATNIGDE